jgi:hypothetical protein
LKGTDGRDRHTLALPTIGGVPFLPRLYEDRCCLYTSTTAADVSVGLRCQGDPVPPNRRAPSEPESSRRHRSLMLIGSGSPIWSPVGPSCSTLGTAPPPLTSRRPPQSQRRSQRRNRLIIEPLAHTHHGA